MPLTIPTLAQVSSTADSKGKVKRAVQRVAKPSEVTATAYVPTLEGSPFEAPVIRPGPSTLKKRLIGFFSSTIAASNEKLLSADSEGGMKGWSSIPPLS